MSEISLKDKVALITGASQGIGAAVAKAYAKAGAHVILVARNQKKHAISKAALETMAQVYADETRQTNIRVNLIDPNVVRTDMRASVKPGEDPESLPTPEDITDDFLKLAADDCTLHGEIIRLS